MIKLDLAELPLNRILGRDIYDNGGKLLLAKSTLLTKEHIKQLSRKGYKEVYLLEELPDTGEDGQQTDRNIDGTLSREITEAVDYVKEFMSRASSGYRVKKSEVQETINLLYPEILATPNILGSLRMLREKEKNEYTLKHSVSVAIIAVKLGQLMKMQDRELKNLGIAALLHDIGKCKISNDIINKPGKLDFEEYREIKRHPYYSFKIVNDICLEDSSILMGVLQHHEQQNGRGYPLRLPAKNIHLYSKIIAVADVFDALTSDRPYHKAISVLNALDEIIKYSTGKLDPLVSCKLHKYILNVIPGGKVMLNSGESATVVMINQDEPRRPLVKIKDGFVNLQQERELVVLDIDV